MPTPIDTQAFRRRFRLLILLAWTVPAVFGLSFLLFIRMFTLEQMADILTRPLEPLFVLVWIGFSLFYFEHLVKPIRRMLDCKAPGPAVFESALARMRWFPLHFWSLFLLYLSTAPSSVIMAASLYSDYSAAPQDWFRIHLVALIVSIIVGLPIFFRLLDLFGQAVTEAPLLRPHVTLRAKVFLIGALMPLLVDTMIVQYYWTRTGYFGFDTFFVWAILELLAIGGSLVFVASIGQSLRPLQSVVAAPGSSVGIDGSRLAPHSTDELGVLAYRYRRLLQEIGIRNEMLHVSNRVFRQKGADTRIGDLMPQILDLCRRAVGGQTVAMLLADPMARELVNVAQTDRPFRQAGYMRISLDESSVASRVFETESPLAVDRVDQDLLSSTGVVGVRRTASVMGAPLDAEGKVIGVLLSLSPVPRKYSDGDIALLEGFAREAALTVHTQMLHIQQAEANAQLQRVNEYNRLLLESTGEGIFGVDADLRCSFVNHAAASLLEYPPEEMQGKKIDEFLCYDDEGQAAIPLQQCPVFRTVREGAGFRVDNSALRTRSGERVPVQYSSNPITVDGRISGAVVVFRDIAKARALARKMEYLASHDVLTGLLNRHRFEQHLGMALEAAQQEGVVHALCYLDLDQFKVVNDTCGHAAGDELLRQVTAELQKHVRHGDILARLGGDEFGLLLQQCPLTQALRLAHALRKTVEEFRFVWQERTFALGVSIGIAAIDAHTQSINDALSNADTACYVAKDAGRNRVHLHQLDDVEVSQRHGEMQWVSRIQDALDQDRFYLVYQTITACRPGPCSGLHMEILVRLRDQHGQDVLPGAFLPAAERFNLSTAVDRWVVRRVIDWMAGLGDRLDHLDLCGVNLSGNTIGEDEFLQFVIQQMETAGVPGAKLCFEVTETAAIAKLTRAVHFIDELKKHGCRFALDDFGSGMSSFGYLKSLPVDYLKIDGSFVRDMTNDHIDRTMVKSINEVGHAMGIRTIAEFVQDEATFKMLEQIGVDYAQGYGVARPLLLSELWS